MFSRARGRSGDETALVRRRLFWGEAFPSTFQSGRHSSTAAPVSTRSQFLCITMPRWPRQQGSDGHRGAVETECPRRLTTASHHGWIVPLRSAGGIRMTRHKAVIAGLETQRLQHYLEQAAPGMKTEI